MPDRYDPPPAQGEPLRVAHGAERPAFPWGAQRLILCEALVSRMEAGALSALGMWDDLCEVLAGNGVPVDARRPAHDVAPRAEFVEERLAALTEFDPATGAIPSALLLDAGPPLCWDDVFKVARILQRSRRVTAPGSQSAGLGAALAPTASFGAFSTRHFLAAQSQAFSNLPQSQVGQQHIDMSMRNAAHAAAGEVEQEARAPAGAPRPLTTALNAALALTAAAATGGTEGVTALGCAVAEMPRNLQVLETMERQGYDPTASPYLSTAAMTLDTISSAFIASAARELLRYEGSFVGPDVPPERKSTSERVIKMVLRGKPLSVNDALLTPSAATSLLSAWDSSVDTAASLHSGLEILTLLGKVVDLFQRSPAGANFFHTAAEQVRKWHRAEKIALSILRDFLIGRLRVFEADAVDFYAGRRPLRPWYSADYLTSPAAHDALASLRHAPKGIAKAMRDALMGSGSSEVRDAIRQAVAEAQGSSSSAVAPAPAPASAPAPAPAAGNGKSRRPKKKRAAPAPAPAAAPASAVAPAVNPPALPPAAAAGVPAVNPNFADTPFAGFATPQEMAAFTAANPVAGHPRGKCFNFWKRGVCRNGAACTFSH